MIYNSEPVTLHYSVLFFLFHLRLTLKQSHSWKKMMKTTPWTQKVIWRWVSWHFSTLKPTWKMILCVGFVCFVLLTGSELVNVAKTLHCRWIKAQNMLEKRYSSIARSHYCIHYTTSSDVVNENYVCRSF